MPARALSRDACIHLRGRQRIQSSGGAQPMAGSRCVSRSSRSRPVSHAPPWSRVRHDHLWVSVWVHRASGSTGGVV